MKAIRIITSLLLCCGLVSGIGIVPVYADQDFDAEVNEENALALLREYDPQGWEIICFTIDQEIATVEDWLKNADSNAEGLGTAIHEEYHRYTHHRNEYFIRENGTYIGTETIRLTDGQEFWIPYRNPDDTHFVTETYARTIPENLRTYRYDTYISEGSECSSNLFGIYGLINEYSAYSWGLHTELCLYPFYDANQTYIDFYNCAINDYQAYAEFRYWILGLLNYERQYAPDYYEMHMNNIEWINAYCGTTRHFEEMNRQFEEYCQVMTDSKTWKPYSERLEDDKESRGINMLKKECASAELSAIEKELFQRCTISFHNEEQPVQENIVSEQKETPAHGKMNRRVPYGRYSSR